MEFEMFVAPVSRPGDGMYFNGNTDLATISAELIANGYAQENEELTVSDVDCDEFVIEPGYDVESYNRFAKWFSQFNSVIDMLDDEDINLLISPDGKIESMDVFDDYLNSMMSPRDAFNLGMWSMDFNENNDFFGFDGYGRLISYSREDIEALLNEMHEDIFRARS